jgi:hypothetical protein
VDRDDPAFRGQADYTPTLLRLYDPLILGPTSRYVRRCPADRLTERYRRHIGDRHLDVGPGTGYFLERSGLAPGVSVTVVEPNTNVLRHTSERLSHLDVTAIEADVCKPLPVEGPLGSAALNLVIHCLPGPFERKAGAVANEAAVLAPDGVLFGSTIVGTTGSHNRVARTLLRDYDRRGVFGNLEDSEEAIGEMPASSFEDVEADTVGSVAIFPARDPATSRTGLGARHAGWMTFRYFAYGSNMWTPRMQARCPSARVVDTAVLRGWRAVFDKPSMDGSAKLNIRPDPPGSVPGVVYEIDRGERELLDRAEPAYRPIATPVGLTYAYEGEATSWPPFAWYVDLVVAGARSHGLEPPPPPARVR